MYPELRDRGFPLSHKREGRTMSLAGLIGGTRGKKLRTTSRDRKAPLAPDLVSSDFRAARSNELSVAGITYAPTPSDFLYPAVVDDAWSRKVVGWSVNTHQRTVLVLKALAIAVHQHRPHGVILNWDQGSQYTSIAFGLGCKEAVLRPSMNSVGVVVSRPRRAWPSSTLLGDGTTRIDVISASVKNPLFSSRGNTFTPLEYPSGSKSIVSE